MSYKYCSSTEYLLPPQAIYYILVLKTFLFVIIFEVIRSALVLLKLCKINENIITSSFKTHKIKKRLELIQKTKTFFFFFWKHIRNENMMFSTYLRLSLFRCLRKFLLLHEKFLKTLLALCLLIKRHRNHPLILQSKYTRWIT